MVKRLTLASLLGAAGTIPARARWASSVTSLPRLVSRPFAKYMLCGLAMLVPISAWAYGCEGTIDSVNLNPNGLVTVVSTPSGLGTFYVCQIGTTANGVGPDTCKAILSFLIAAKASGATVGWQFNDGAACTGRQQWSWLTGWYYGPSLL